jgi:hypothetical protein
MRYSPFTNNLRFLSPLPYPNDHVAPLPLHPGAREMQSPTASSTARHPREL